MIEEHDLSTVVRSWLQEVPVMSERARVSAEVRARVHETRQSHPRWSAGWPVLRRGGLPAGGGRQAGDRSGTMLAVTRIAAATVVVIGAGTLLLAVGGGPAPLPTVAPVSSTPTPSPAARPLTGLLSRLVTEEVEPGVLRLVGDGHRELSAPWDTRRIQGQSIAAGPDGSVWVLDLDSFFRLGAPETFPGLELSERPGSMMPSIMPLSAKVGPDGTLWALDGGTRDGQAATYDGTLRSFDGKTWTDRAEHVHAFDITADGTVWAAWGDGVVGRLGTDGFVPGDLGVRGPAAPDDFAVTDVGAIWLHDPATDVLIRQQGDYTSSSEGLTAHVGPLHKGPHGSLWVYQEASLPTVRGNTVQQDTHVPYFVRFDPSDPEVESPRTVYTQEDGVPILPDVHAIEGFLGVAPDGSLWLTGYDEDGQPFGGLRRWDGSSTTTYLEGGGVVALDIGPDGTVWVRATEGLGGSLRTYAIPGSAGGPP